MSQRNHVLTARLAHYNFPSCISHDLGWIRVRHIHSSNTSGASGSDEPSSKVEETLKNVKQQLEEKEKGLVPVPKRSIWKRIEDVVILFPA